MEGSGRMRTALLVLLIAAFVCTEGRNMPSGQQVDQPQTFGSLGGDGGTGLGGMGGMGVMPGIGSGIPSFGMLNPPAFGLGFMNPPGFAVGGWPGMMIPPGLGHGGGGMSGLNPPAIGHGGGGMSRLNPPAIGHGGGGLGFSMVNPSEPTGPFTFPGFGGVPDMVGTIPHPTEQGNASP